MRAAMSSRGRAGFGERGNCRVDSLRVGRATATDLMACTMDLSALRVVGGVRGLFGLNFLRNFRVTLDFRRNLLTLTQPR